MSKRPGNAAFAAAPIFQGHWDGTGTPDVVSFPRGTLLGNQTQLFYSNLDLHQGTISFWIRPEWDGTDGKRHVILDAGFVGNLYLFKETIPDIIYFYVGGQQYAASVAGWTAGTTYYMCASWDTRNTINGTNYLRLSVNGAHTYGVTTAPSISSVAANISIGSKIGPTNGLDAIIGGLCISRVVWYDGTYGVPMWFDDSGPIDMIAAVYDAGPPAGEDPATIFGSFDVTTFVPTDQTQGVLATTGQAHSHPHGSQLIDVPYLDDGGLPGTDYAVEFNGTNTVIDCGSGATLDDIPAGGGDISVDCWFRSDGEGDEAFGSLLSKFGSGTGYHLSVSYNNDRLYSAVNDATTDAVASAAAAAFGLDTLMDGKWHLATFHYEDVTKWISLAVDGRWASSYVTRTQGVGAYVSEAAQDWRFGFAGAVYPFLGAIAWCEVSDNDRHSAGTDFIPPRAPYSDGNTVEYWAMDEGTGATVAASVTSPANDGTITPAGVWSAIWAIVGTPEIPQSLQFFQENDGIAFLGGTPNIDDLFTADCTIECYVMLPEAPTSTAYILTKSDGGVTVGWRLFTSVSRQVSVDAQFATNDIQITGTAVLTVGVWYHLAVDFDFGTLTARLFINGELEATDAAVGAYQSGAAQKLICNGIINVGTVDSAITIGPIRLSDNRRYTGNSFIPPSRNNWPANDANAQLITRMNDGAGTTVTDYSGNGYNGTVTFGATTRWNNTPDLLIDESGRMIYQQGYNIGSDGANDGIYIPHTLTAATDYVIRVPMQYSPRAWPRITLWDVTGAAAIVDFDAPPLTAVHDGAAGAAAFTSTGEVYPASLIGSTIYNPTDGSSGTITAVGGTNQDTITAALSGGVSR
jgi:hypothetical protein